MCRPVNCGQPTYNYPSQPTVIDGTDGNDKITVEPWENGGVAVTMTDESGKTHVDFLLEEDAKNLEIRGGGYDEVKVDPSVAKGLRIAGAEHVDFSDSQPIVIDGTNGDDKITVMPGENGAVVVDVNGTQIEYSAEEAERLQIKAGGGYDEVKVDPSVAKGLKISGAEHVDFNGSTEKIEDPGRGCWEPHHCKISDRGEHGGLIKLLLNLLQDRWSEEDRVPQGPEVRDHRHQHAVAQGGVVVRDHRIS
jgi:hypothetical protein